MSNPLRRWLDRIWPRVTLTVFVALALWLLHLDLGSGLWAGLTVMAVLGLGIGLVVMTVLCVVWMFGEIWTFIRR